MLPAVKDKATKKVKVSFRRLFPFPSTTYGLFGLYKYPAKFIPHVPLYALKEYASEGDTILDPFAGQGSVGFACWLTGNSYELWDINPILEFLHSFVYIGEINELRIMKALEKLTQEKFIYLPDWDNIDYWYPEEFKELLGKAWFSVKNIEEENTKKILTLALLKVSRFLSYADEKVHKLYRSKRAIQKVKELLRKDYKSIFKERLRAEAMNILEKLAEWRKLEIKSPKSVSVYIGDIFEKELNREVDILLTSPPYIQAQEYIRSTKLELYWLGFTDEKIRELSNKEIPYRKEKINVEINSSLYWDIFNKISGDSVCQVFANYFNSLIYILDRLSEKVKRYMLLFVGPVHVRDIQVPIDDIITEHFLNKGWKHRLTYIDTVKSRVMFNTKTYINPSTGLKNKRMETEMLIVLERC